MTLNLTTTQAAERLTVTLVCTPANSQFSAYIIVDGKAYDAGVWTPGTLYTFTRDFTLERGPHVIYAQGGDSAGTVTTSPITYVMAYELATYGIDLYSGDAKLDVFGVTLHDELLPALPTLNFSCAVLLTGTVQVVIRERGLKQYQFTIATVAVSGGIYTYTCKAAESYALTTAIMALQTAYGATSDAIALVAPSLNIVNANLLTQTTYPQLFQNIQPLNVIEQLMVQALAQASVRNGNLYVFPLDMSAQVPDYHMQRLDPLTAWQRDADIYDAVQAHYLIKQYPSPDTILTLSDASNWTSTGTPTSPLTTSPANVAQTLVNLLPVPSGALGMLYANGNASRAGISAAFKDFDRIRFNWNPATGGAGGTATYVDISLQQDGANKLDLRHTFAGQTGCGFLLQGAPGVSTDILTENIALSPVQFVTTVTGTTTEGCSYRVTLLDATGATLWQDVWSSTIGSDNTFSAHVPKTVSRVYQATTVRIEFTSLYLVGTDYGVQCVQCDITVQTWNVVGTHEHAVSNTEYFITLAFHSDVGYHWGSQTLSGATAGQWYWVVPPDFGPPLAMTMYDESFTLSDLTHYWAGGEHVVYTESRKVYILETVTDYAWVPSPFVWSSAFNLFESLDLALSAFTRTGSPTNLATIALTFTGDNYVDSLVLVADNPLPVTVRAGTGSRAYVVTDDFGSEAGAQAYADGLLPIVSVAREQYTRDVPLSTDLSVGDTVNADGVNMTVYAVDYRQDGKTLAAGKAMDTLMTRLAEQARRLGTLERKGA